VVEFNELLAREAERSYLTPEIVRQRTRTLETLTLQSGEHVLDVGCGPGLLTREMALEVGPEGRVSGVDKSPAMLDLAKRRCAQLTHVHLKDGVAENLPEGDQSFHAVACIQVLLYVADVQRALGEMQRVLKPGGRIAIVETDWHGAVLNSSDQALTRRIMAAWDDEVPSPNLPVRLGPLMQKNGFEAIRVEAIPLLNTTYSPENFSAGTVEWIARTAREQGIVNEGEATGWLEDLRRRGSEEAYFFCVNRFLFSAVRS
jgi:SAM-dependent methyltransferase